MRIATGIDIIEVGRIKEAIDGMGESFLNRIYTEEEIHYCNSSNMMKYQHFAARFAAKEAVFKALSKFISGREELDWKDIEVVKEKSGKPAINVDKIHKKLDKDADIKLIDIDISLSHIKEYAVANAVVLFE